MEEILKDIGLANAKPIFYNKQMKQRLVELIKIAFYILLYCVVLKILNITCPIKFLTGISCAGCGMTRAWLAFLTGNFKEAFYYHPLFLSVPILAIIYLFKDKMPKKLFSSIIVLYLIMFLVCYGIRLADPSNTIVTCDIKESIIYKLLIGG